MARSLYAAVTLVAATLFGVPAVHIEGTWSVQIDLSQTAAFPGDSVSFTGNGPSAVGEGACVAQFAGLPAEADCTFDLNGAISGSVIVPADAEPGSGVVSICWPQCGDGLTDPDPIPEYWQSNLDLLVEGPPVLGVVPDVSCQSLADATATLKESGFQAKVLAGLGAVHDQRPDPNEAASPGQVVDLYLQPVVVPDVTTLTYSDAAQELESSCLQAFVDGGDQSGAVSSQLPRARTPAVAGDVVTLTFPGAGAGSSSDPGLVGAGGGDENSTHTGSGEGDGLRRNTSLIWMILLFGTLAAGAVGMWHHQTRPRRDLAWVMQHVTVGSLPGPAPGCASHRLEPSSKDYIIRVNARDDSRSIAVEEESP